MPTEKNRSYAIIRSNRRSFEIAVLPEGSIQIRAPQRATNEQIHQIYQSKLGWIDKKMRAVSQRHPGYGDRKFISGESFLYMGQMVKLEVVHGFKAVRIIDEDLVVAIKASKGLEEDQKAVEKSLELWYRQCAQRVIVSRVQHWQQLIGKEPVAVKVKEQKSRWGSCTGKNEILMNWKLIMAPLDVIDYVVVHELCHLFIRDHSARYWALVETHMPNWKEKRQWLKENGHLLTFNK